MKSMKGMKGGKGPGIVGAGIQIDISVYAVIHKDI